MLKKKRSKEEIISRMNDVGTMNRFCGRRISRRVEGEGNVAVIDVENRTIPFVLVSKDNAGERYDWWNDEVYIEELDPHGARLDELKTFFKDHSQSVDTATGRIENARVDTDGQIKSDVIFGTDDESDRVFIKYQDRILTDVSVGYYVHDIVVTSKKDEPDHVFVTDYTIVELSAVWKGFDKGATMGRSTPQPKGESKKLRNTEILRKKLNLKNKDLK